jgi:hypothetical protein
MVNGLEGFGKHVLETMWKHISDHFPAEAITRDPRLANRSYHEDFIESHSRHFVGRAALIKKITGNTNLFYQLNIKNLILLDYVNEQIISPIVIIGEPGSGKTSLGSYFILCYFI